METAGVMEQVRGLLSTGLKSAEIIAQGYAPSTVYGVQRNLRKRQGLLGSSFPTTALNPHGYQARLASENRWLRRRVEALEDRGAEAPGDSDGASLLQRLEDVEEAVEQLLARQQQVGRALGQWSRWADRIESDLDDLALVYRDDLLFGIGEPKWQRRRREEHEEEGKQ